MRGRIFQIGAVTFFTFGGADSVDKQFRKEGVSWWPQERQTEEEFAEGMNNLAKHNYLVDYIITHTAPQDIVAQLGYLREDTTLGNYTALYYQLKCLKQQNTL